MGTVNHLFIFGNGFDKNLGLPTSYKEFYDYYLALEEPAGVAVQLLKQEIESEEQNWSDLEIQLGKFVKRLSSVQELDDVILDLTDNLSRYLENVERETKGLSDKRDRFIEDLLNPERVLTNRDKQKLNAYQAPFRNANDTLNIGILTFNYTRCVEMILGEIEQPLSIDHSLSSFIENNVSEVLHVHGSLDDGIILGVDNVGQIANEKLTKNIDATELLVKPSHNESLGHLIDEQCRELIRSAMMIYIFGSSIGETDKMWWQEISAKLRQRQARLVIFYYSDERRGNRRVLEARKQREIIDRFFSYTDFTENEKQVISDFIFVAPTGDLFNLKY